MSRAAVKLALAETTVTILNKSLGDMPRGSHFTQWCKVYHVVAAIPEAEPTWHYLISNVHLQQLEPGDVIVMRSQAGWLSYAAYKPGATKICFTDKCGQPIHDFGGLFQANVKVHIMRLESIMQLLSFTVVRQRNKAETLTRAYFLMRQEREWSFFHFNSEHFSSFVVIGELQSQQPYL